MSDRFVALDRSPLVPGVSPVRIHCRDEGTGPALIVLHGGWGYAMYPFDRQIAALAPRFRILVPDRSGYGESSALDMQRTDFHQRAAEETIAVMDALGIGRAMLWGHSDGAVVALRLGIAAPDRVVAIVAEATHYFRRKPRSRDFFETMRDRPEQLGDRVVATLGAEHGERWRALIATNGDAWLRIAEESRSADADLYDGRLPHLAAPVLVVHGLRDPRTEPGELAALRTALDRQGRAASAQATSVLLLDDGGHSPHSERTTADAVTAAASRFLAQFAPAPAAVHSR